MELLAQTLITGILLGGVYGLIAMGLSLAFGVMRIVNFAHGALVAIGMYAVIALYRADVNPFVSLALMVPIGLLFGALLQGSLLNWVTGKSELRQLLLTLGFGMVVQAVLQALFTPGQVGLTGFAWGSQLVQVGPLYLKPAHLVGFVIAIVIAIAFALLLRYSALGRQMRATVDDAEIAESSGVRSKYIYILAMGIGTAIAMIAGGVLVTYRPAIPTIGNEFLLIAFVAVVLGGLRNIIGAFVGGLIAGVMQQLTAAFVSPALQDVGLFALFILVLIFKPAGLFSRKGETV